jgi:N-methylhydantoinase A
MPARSTSIPLRIAIDTGGTFTDCVWIDPESGALKALKLFSTPKDPSQAIADAVSQIAGSRPVTLLHGTTVGTNALLQRKGGRVAFVTTKGFEDSIEIGRQARPKLYDFFFDAIEPLVARDMRFGVNERTDKDGVVLARPKGAELERLRARIKKARADAIAISFLFSFANPANERTSALALQRLKIPLSVSNEVLPEFREYERASTVVINAYLQPVMAQYLQRISGRLGQGSRAFVMQSSGGLTSLATASREPVRTVLSGPAGGVVGAAAMAQRSGYANIIGFDMGGTSTDVCLVDGSPTVTNEAEVAGLPVRVPMLNIHTVGAGGGSLARFDAGGALRVGPESAGALPGPICYGKGTQPTVTDANLLLGRLPAKRFLGGGFELDVERTKKLTAEWLRRQKSKLSVMHFAEGVVRIVNANMEKAIRVVSIDKGFDTRDFSLVAFGGAGAMHACELAAALEMPRVIVPALPGALSAVGILMSDVVKDYSRTLLWGCEKELSTPTLEGEFRKLELNARDAFKAEGWPGKVETERWLEMRYAGQGFEIAVPFGPRAMSQFHADHKRRYGYSLLQNDVEIVNIRLRAWIRTPNPKAKNDSRPSQKLGETATEMVFDGKSLRGKIYERTSLGRGKSVSGPAIISEYSGTTVVPLGWKVTIDHVGNMILTLKTKRTA